MHVYNYVHIHTQTINLHEHKCGIVVNVENIKRNKPTKMNRIFLLTLMFTSVAVFGQLKSDKLATKETALTYIEGSYAQRVSVPDTQSLNEAQPAVSTILAAFDKYPIVALGMSHWQQSEADFTLELVRNPEFPKKVNDIVVECGNPLYQAVLDHYIAGDTVDIEKLQLVWRNTTQPGRCDPRQHKELLDAVREVNRLLPPTHKIRVLAGDSPINWEMIRKPEDVQKFLSQRDPDFASVVQHEVLEKHRKALLIIGAAHVLRRPVSWRNENSSPAPTITMLLESKFPNSTFIIIPHDGFGERLSEFEKRFVKWEKPSIVLLKKSWLGDVEGGVLFGGNIRRVGSDPRQIDDPYPGFRLNDLADAFLYLGPLSSLSRVEFPSPEAGSDYARELERRRNLLGEEPAPARIVPH